MLDFNIYYLTFYKDKKNLIIKKSIKQKSTKKICVLYNYVVCLDCNLVWMLVWQVCLV